MRKSAPKRSLIGSTTATVYLAAVGESALCSVPGPSSSLGDTGSPQLTSELAARPAARSLVVRIDPSLRNRVRAAVTSPSDPGRALWRMHWVVRTDQAGIKSAAMRV